MPRNIDPKVMQRWIEKPRDLREVLDCLALGENSTSKPLLLVDKPTTTLVDMIRAGKYDWISGSIIEEHFHTNPELFNVDGLKTIHYYGKAMASQQVLVDLDERGLRPASIEQLLAYGVKNPEEQRQYPIVGLGSFWVDSGGRRYVPCLFENAGERALSLDWEFPGGQWHGRFRFLASRKSGTGAWILDPGDPAF